MDNENVANNNESVANNNENVAINKSPATTCCGSGSNEIGATNKYKYGANNNKSGTTCCCGCVSIETGTYVAAIVLCVHYIIWAILFFLLEPIFGIFGIIEVVICLLVVCGQKARNRWLFLPYLFVGAYDLVLRGICIFASLACWLRLFEFGRSSGILCFYLLCYFAVTFPLFVWFYSITLRGFSTVKEVESRRYRPHF